MQEERSFPVVSAGCTRGEDFSGGLPQPSTQNAQSLSDPAALAYPDGHRHCTLGTPPTLNPTNSLCFSTPCIPGLSPEALLTQSLGPPDLFSKLMPPPAPSAGLCVCPSTTAYLNHTGLLPACLRTVDQPTSLSSSRLQQHLLQ